MKLISWHSPSARVGGTWATDMDVVEFVAGMLRTQYNDTCITHVQEMTKDEIVKWRRYNQYFFLRKDVNVTY